MENNLQFYALIKVLEAQKKYSIAKLLQELVQGIYKTERETKKEAINKIFIMLNDHNIGHKDMICMSDERNFVDVMLKEKIIRNQCRYSDNEIKLKMTTSDLEINILTCWKDSNIAIVKENMQNPEQVYTKISVKFIYFTEIHKEDNTLVCFIPWF